MAKTKLCFLPHAGGSAMTYTSFKMYLDPDIKPVALEPAGRGARLAEPCYQDLKACAKDLLEHHKDIFEGGDYALFGHSMGSLLAYELTKEIKAHDLPSPKHLFLSARPAPQSNAMGEYSGISKKSDAEIKELFIKSGALPAMIVNNKQLMDMMFPILKADVCMVDHYKADLDHLAIDSDISVLHGLSDKMYRGDDLPLWSKCTTGSVDSYGFQGGHFYYSVPETKKKVCTMINSILIG